MHRKSSKTNDNPLNRELSETEAKTRDVTESFPGIRIRETHAKSWAGKSRIPSMDYAINPYIGCPHRCAYCYAAYMDEYDPHPDPWGSYLDVRLCDEPLDAAKLTGKSIFISSVTDPYNPAEAEYGLMRKILDQLSHIECSIRISTKSDLVLRDMDLLQLQSDAIVCMSLNTLNERFRSDMDSGSSVAKRLAALQELHGNGIRTGIHVSPIFPELTDPDEIVRQTMGYVDEYMFEDLKLRYPYKWEVLKYIQGKHPHLTDLYHEIYVQSDRSYFDLLRKEIAETCDELDVAYTMAFHDPDHYSGDDLSRDDPFGGDSLFKLIQP